MKKFLKIFGVLLLFVLAGSYIAFLFVLPKAVDLNIYKPMVQEIAKEQTKLNVNFEDLKITTSPSLSVGVKAKDISIKLPDNSTLFSADKVKIRVSLPSLLFLTVKVSCAEVSSPKINLDIKDSKQFKISTLIENIVNEKKDISKVEAPPEPLPFDPSIIKIKVPAIKISNYQFAVNDPKAKQNLLLKGDNLTLGYFNGKVLKLKTDAKVLCDNKENITANIDINTFIPTMEPKLDEDDDSAKRLEIPFVNPIDIYKDYNLKSDINTKLKIRNKDNLLTLNGFLNIENTTMNLSGYQLPLCYLKYKFNGTSVDMDTDFYVAKDENIKFLGNINYGKKPSMNLDVLTKEIQFNDCITLARAVLDTLHIKHDLYTLKGNGFFLANTKIQTDFKKLKSNGSIIVRNGGLSDKKIGLLIKDTNINLIFDNNMLQIKDTHSDINGAVIKADGKIDEKSYADIGIYTDNLPLAPLYRALAPTDLKQNYFLNSGNLSLNAKITGELKDANAKINLALKDFSFADKANNFRIANNNFNTLITSDFKNITGDILNKDLKIMLPSTSSTLTIPIININLDNENITLSKTGLKLNNSSVINFYGDILNYSKHPEIIFSASGNIAAADLQKLAGNDVLPFIRANGKIPLKFSVTGNNRRQNMILQILADANNHFTPIDIQQLINKQSIIQAKIDFKGNRIKIKDTGLYVKQTASEFTENYDANMRNTHEIAGLSGTIANLDTPSPTINLFTAAIPKELNASLYAFKNSSFKTNGRIFVFGNTVTPRIRGHFRIYDVSIPDLFLTMEKITIGFRARKLDFNLANILVNGSDFNIDGNLDLNTLPLISLSDLNILSNRINVNSLMQVSEAAAKFAPKTTSSVSSQPSDIPVEIRSGHINFRRINADPIIASNTNARIALHNNIFFLNNLRTNALGGSVNGRINMNLLTSALRIAVRGSGFNVERTLLVLANMKDAISGTASFETDITLQGATYEEQMKSLKGNVKFEITDGQLGPFGKIENFILAENIRESQFFQTTIGSVINSITSINTSHFTNLNGSLDFADGIVKLNPIASIGDILCLEITGDMDLLANTADMQLRGRLASTVSDMLGPLANLNPVNLIKNTPGLNIVAAKAFFLFCEEIPQEEMNAIPDFSDNHSDANATKFQVIIRGDVAKPLSLVKSFKWLAVESDIQNALAFVATLPEPEEGQMDNPNAEIQVSQKAKKESFWKKIFKHKKNKK